ncbi:pimeloyl-ACP methyl ester carboxylesterase [Allocatelliglobosispora scoriae]|uniref:Pimeloyl-ACP methyl ester carboxylesterase n=1 Tax=Allocatelliglobosispora scoriae TaxID=643052 RepID=A0A841BJW0_9ACTN|nr:alpha/beta hydrolase [Allocatelliglobosispora scoriae]MBB5867496.1 pimeloyl-ACP methyl ester carboxylesterase [Allocatelliglobosispora scoriae]
MNHASAPAQEATGVEPRVVTVALGSILVRYREYGRPDAPALVLLHGGTSSAATWDRLASTLAGQGWRTVAVDLRGHGGSTRALTYPLDAYHVDIVGLLDALGLDRVALVGHSLGAYVASLVAAARPELISHLILEEPPVPGRDDTDEDGLYAPRFLLESLALLVLRRGYHRRAVVSALRQLHRPNPEWWRRLATIRARTLVVWGGPASHLSHERLALVTAAVPGARLVTIDAGHLVHSKRPAEFYDTVADFLAS